MLYDHHRCSESAGASWPIFVALNRVKLYKKRKYLYSSVWQWAHTHECKVLRLRGGNKQEGVRAVARQRVG